MFLDHVAALLDYWEKQERTKRDCMEGVVFSLLASTDGSSAELPGFLLVPHPHPSDRGVREGSGRNWWPSEGDIAGGLHECLFKAIEKWKGRAEKKD
jgi:hypothetical protein